MSARLLLATGNKKKLVELQRILDTALGVAQIELVGLGEHDTGVDEDRRVLP